MVTVSLMLFELHLGQEAEAKPEWLKEWIDDIEGRLRDRMNLIDQLQGIVHLIERRDISTSS